MVVYEKRACSSCRRLATVLTERGIDFAAVEFHVEGLSEALAERPIAEQGDRAVLARPVDKVLELL